MKITKHAQSCFLIETRRSRILIDAGTFVFKEEGRRPEDFGKIDILIFTHEHFDHFDVENIKKIIELNQPKIIGTRAIADQLTGVAKVELTGANFNHQYVDFRVVGYISEHGPLPNGSESPQVNGAVIDDGKNRFYTPGDSLFLDQNSNADIIAVPICGMVVMNIGQAKLELLKLKPKIAIPIHYDNPRFPVNVADFEIAMRNTGIEVKILKWGESIEAVNG